jgi:hypothetical protein
MGEKVVIHLAVDKNSLLAQAIEGVMEEHRKYCGYPCFTEGDIVFCILRREGYVPINEWEAFKSEFGNVSFEHLLDASNEVERWIKGEENL